MGKFENIKRAKRLKKAKKEKEQEALFTKGSETLNEPLQNRNINNGLETSLNDSEVKYSNLLEEFVHFIVNEEDNISLVKTKYMFGVYTWNAAILREKSEKDFQLAKNNISSIIPDSPEIEQLFDGLVKRKQEEFSEYKNIIVDFEIKEMGEHNYDLTVATIPLKVE